MLSDTERHDSNGTIWYLNNVPSEDRQKSDPDSYMPECSCCGLPVASAVAWFDDEFVDRSLLVLHEYCFETYDETLRYLKNGRVAI